METNVVNLYVCSDIHGFYKEFRRALKNAGFDEKNPCDVLVILGDLLDRGREPQKCINFVNRLPKGRKILIRGNHEDMQEKAIRYQKFQIHDYLNGTVQSFCDIYRSFFKIPIDYCLDDHMALDFMRTYKPLMKYFDSLVDYAEIGNNIFVHGWIPVGIKYTDDQLSKSIDIFNENWREADKEAWYKSRWMNGMKAWSEGLREQGKTIYCGHWHTSWGHQNLHKETNENYESFIDEGIVALDACTLVSGFVNCCKVEVTKEEYRDYLSQIVND